MSCLRADSKRPRGFARPALAQKTIVNCAEGAPGRNCDPVLVMPFIRSTPFTSLWASASTGPQATNWARNRGEGFPA